MKKFTRMTAVVMAVALLALACVGCGGNSGGDTIMIGCTGPLTGDASSYGISVQHGAQLAVEEINAAGGLNGVKLSFEMKDDKATAEDASTGYDALYDAGMKISLGSVTSASCKAFADKAVQDNVFAITPSASEQAIIEKGDNIFRVCFGDPDQGTLAAKELTKTYTKIGAIYDTSDSYSTGIYTAFEAEMKAEGKEFKVQTFDKENNKDFSTQVEALKDCEVIFMPFYYTEAGLVAKACVAKGVTAELFGCDGFDGIKTQLDDTVTNKIRYITPFDVESTDSKVSTFVSAYKAKFGSDPDQFAADAYDAVYVIFEGMKAAGVDSASISASDLCNKVKAAITNKSFSYTGTTGKMTWETSGACDKDPVIVDLSK